MEMYKDKLPNFPPKKIKSKSTQVITERKKSLACKYLFFFDRLCLEYFNILAKSINIFADPPIVKFLKLDFESFHVKNLKDLLDKNLEWYERLSAKSLSSSSIT
jgi:hypothetical protein